MVELFWTEKAKQSLHEIHAYIAQHNPTAAKSVVKSIQKKSAIAHTIP